MFLRCFNNQCGLGASIWTQANALYRKSHVSVLRLGAGELPKVVLDTGPGPSF